jgi:hypothetical protein
MMASKKRLPKVHEVTGKTPMTPAQKKLYEEAKRRAAAHKAKRKAKKGKKK